MTGEHQDAPEIGFSRLLVVASGSLSAALLPYWANWLHLGYPRLTTRFMVTRTAERFVTRGALAAVSGSAVLADAWPDEETTALHVELAEWAEAILVYPATMHYLGRLALGLADSPSLLAAHCTSAPVVVAPSVPPGGRHSQVYQAHVVALRERGNVVVAPPSPGRSVTTGRNDAWMPALFPTCLAMLEKCRRGLSTDTAREPAEAAAGNGSR